MSVLFVLGVLMVTDMKITIVYDNNPYKPGFETDWGFSVLIEGDGKKILFDTGGDGEILLRNLDRLGVDPKTIEIVFFSHIHFDHIGGCRSLLRVNPEIKAILPRSFPERFKRSLKCKEITEFQEILPGFYSTGELGTAILEQSLVIRANQGLVIITGCAHPGIVDIVSEVKRNLDDPIFLLLGGFHLFGVGEGEIRKIADQLKKLGVTRIAPCHCSGDKAREVFKREYEKCFIEVGVGWNEEIKDGNPTE